VAVECERERKRERAGTGGGERDREKERERVCKGSSPFFLVDGYVYEEGWSEVRERGRKGESKRGEIEEER